MLLEIAMNPWIWAVGTMLGTTFYSRNPSKGTFVGIFCGATAEVFRFFLQIGGT